MYARVYETNIIKVKLKLTARTLYLIGGFIIIIINVKMCSSAT